MRNPPYLQPAADAGAFVHKSLSPQRRVSATVGNVGAAMAATGLYRESLIAAVAAPTEAGRRDASVGKEHMPALDGVRGLAALAVVVSPSSGQVRGLGSGELRRVRGCCCSSRSAAF